MNVKKEKMQNDIHTNFRSSFKQEVDYNNKWQRPVITGVMACPARPANEQGDTG